MVREFIGKIRSKFNSADVPNNVSGTAPGTELPSIDTENTIKVPGKAIEAMYGLDIGGLIDHSIDDGVGTFSVLGNAAGIESLLREVGIPFIRTETFLMMVYTRAVFVPEHNNNPMRHVFMPSSEDGKPFVTIDELEAMLCLGPDWLAHNVREFAAEMKVDLAAWNDIINVEKVRKLIKLNQAKHNVAYGPDNYEEWETPCTYTEGTIQIPEKAVQVISQVPKGQLGVGGLMDASNNDGIASITAVGTYGTFEELEDLLRKLKIPFIRQARREIGQHEIDVFVPEHDNQPAQNATIPCDMDGEPFVTIDELEVMLTAFGPNGLANKLRRLAAKTKVDLAAWNEIIDIDECGQLIEETYVNVKAFRDAKTTYPKASVERCQAFANCMAHLTDPSFFISFGFEGPSAREYYVYNHAEAKGHPLGKSSYDEARKFLISKNGPIFGELNDEMKTTILENKSTGDCPEDIKKAEAEKPSKS